MGRLKWSSLKKTASSFSPSFYISLVILTAIVMATILAPYLASQNPNRIDITKSLLDPSSAHLFGTDKSGRDIYSRMLYGGRTTLLGALGITAFSALIGIPIGLLCGFFGGWFDTLVMRLWDINLAFPTLLLAFVFVTCFGRNLTNIVIAMGIIYLPMISRLARALVLSESNKPYIEACHSLGYSNMRIIFLHILPNCAQSLVVQVTVYLANSILSLASLSFLGLGVQPPTADWGEMLQEGQQFILVKPLLAIIPGIAIILVIISINVVSDDLQAFWDPLQRRRPEKWETPLLRANRAGGTHG